MNTGGNPPGGKHRRRSLAALCCLLAAPTVEGRTYHSAEFGELTVGCNSVNTTSLPAESITRYGFTQDESFGVLSCVVQSRNSQSLLENVLVPMRAYYRIPGQARRVVDLDEVLDGEQVSMAGQYRVIPPFPVHFEVELELPALGTVEVSFVDDDPSV